MSSDDGGPQTDVDAPGTTRTSQNKKMENKENLPQKRKSPAASPGPPDGSAAKRVKVDDDDATTTVSKGETRSENNNAKEPETGNEVSRREPSQSRHDGLAGKDLSGDAQSTEARKETLASGPDRRRNFSQEERKRGQRLFGGLMSTLSQTTGNSQQKRRLEIEKRQQEKAQQQKLEADHRQAEKLAKLNKIRKVEQVKFDEQVMRTRHASMLALARSLQTKSVPRLYYRPWELTREQESKIEAQIRDAEATIEEEVQQFKQRREQRLKELGAYRPSSSDAVGEPLEVHSNTVPAESNDSNPPPPPKHERDHDDDVVDEAEEDTVIY